MKGPKARVGLAGELASVELIHDGLNPEEIVALCCILHALVEHVVQLGGGEGSDPEGLFLRESHGVKFLLFCFVLRSKDMALIYFSQVKSVKMWHFFTI